MALKDFLLKAMKRDEEFKEMERQNLLNKKLEAKQKNSNERELNRFEEEERQKMIKLKLEKFRKQKNDEFWHGPNILEQKNIFADHKSILTDNPNLLQAQKINKNKFKTPNMFFK